mmetsp:Transcript_16635/g.43686  ORF Transcript_16635/g.43686 Transcript_16635/m.43686 type:complete len:339 (+) Transcript_16635:660-1676(+)
MSCVGASTRWAAGRLSSFATTTCPPATWSLTKRATARSTSSTSSTPRTIIAPSTSQTISSNTPDRGPCAWIGCRRRQRRRTFSHAMRARLMWRRRPTRRTWMCTPCTPRSRPSSRRRISSGVCGRSRGVQEWGATTPDPRNLTIVAMHRSGWRWSSRRTPPPRVRARARARSCQPTPTWRPTVVRTTSQPQRTWWRRSRRSRSAGALNRRLTCRPRPLNLQRCHPSRRSRTMSTPRSTTMCSGSTQALSRLPPASPRPARGSARTRCACSTQAAARATSSARWLLSTAWARWWAWSPMMACARVRTPRRRPSAAASPSSRAVSSSRRRPSPPAPSTSS